MAPQAAARPAVNAQTVQRLKVLFITNWYPSAAQPGTALWVREHAKAAGIFNDVAVLHCAGPQPELDAPWSIQRESELRREEGIPTYRLSYRPPLLGRLRYAVYVCTMLRGIAHVSGAGFSPDVLHVHVYDAGVPAVIFGRLRRIPVAVSEHFSSFPARRLGRLDLLKARLAMRWADAVLPVSAFLQKALEDYGIEARYHLVPNVVDTELFHPPLQPAREGAGWCPSRTWPI
jgi:glycosyltransferase involved in cell wall biosynthesis